MVSVAKETSSGFSIIAGYTDVFVLALYHFDKQQLKVPVIIELTVQDRAKIDISTTVETKKTIVSDLPAVHALSGCDIVSICNGIDKATSFKVILSKTCQVNSVGDETAEF